MGYQVLEIVGLFGVQTYPEYGRSAGLKEAGK
jgi:hypothetical protein